MDTNRLPPLNSLRAFEAVNRRRILPPDRRTKLTPLI